MGTAPRDRQYPAMPDPERFTRRSVLFLRRLGMSEQLAVETVLVVAERVSVMASERSPAFRGWLEDIKGWAEHRQRSLGSNQTDREGTGHANG